MRSATDIQLAAMVDRERAELEQVYCLDDLDLCNLCGKTLDKERFIIDGEVKETPQTILPNGGSAGQWAYMCTHCFSTRGVGIGWGRGQLYEQISDGEWLQVAGFQPESDDEI